MSTTPNAGCEHCNKSTLSLLLLRPSPIARDHRLEPAGAKGMAADGLVEGLVPARAPTESHYALRLLRPGYVHVYIPDPPMGVKAWQSYRISDNADVIEESSAVFAQQPAPPACTRKDHNAMGMRLLRIPQAHEISELWIAFSANRWNDKLKAQNKANPEVMQKISLTTCGKHTFQPTADALKRQVLEFALLSMNIDGARDHDFPFVSLCGQAEAMARQMTEAAAGHPQTRGHEMAIVLRDPVGVATELNALRLRRHEMARRAIEAEAAKPKNAWPLKSSDALLGLKELYARVEYAKALDKYAPLVTWREYVNPYPGTIFGGATTAPLRFDKATWEPLESEARPGWGGIRDNDLGRVWFPDSNKRILAESQRELDSAWGKIEKKYNEKENGGRAQWVKDFHDRMKREHLDAVAKFEDDWWGAACRDAAFRHYFATHFDDTDPNAPLATYSPGLTYAREVSISTTPAPLTTGQVLSDYTDELSADPDQPSSMMLRALAANQKEIIALLKPVWAIEEAATYAYAKRSGKLYSLGTGLVRQLGAEGKFARVGARYSWLGPALGNLFGGYAMTVAGGLNGAVVALCAASGSAFLSSELGKKLVMRAQGIALIQRTSDLALVSIKNHTPLAVPLQITKRYPAGKAIYLLVRERGGYSSAQTAGLIRDGTIELTLLTDNHELAQYGGDIDAAIGGGAGKVQTPAKPTAAILTSAEAIERIKLTDVQFDTLWQQGQSRLGQARQAATQWMEAKKVVLTSLDGRLALGSLMFSGLGLIGAFGNIHDQREEVRRAAWFGMVDGTSGTLGAFAGVWGVVLKNQLMAQGGKEAVAASVTMQSLRIAGHFTGAVGGLLGAGLNFLRAWDAARAGDMGEARLYGFSGLAFIGTTTTFGVLATGAIADRMVAKGVARAVAIRIAARFGAQGVLASSVTFWGWILLGVAVLFEIGAVIMTPTEMQKWAARTWFGKGGDKFKDWAEEERELNHLFDPPADPQKPIQSPPVMIFPIIIPGGGGPDLGPLEA